MGDQEDLQMMLGTDLARRGSAPWQPKEGVQDRSAGARGSIPVHRRPSEAVTFGAKEIVEGPMRGGGVRMVDGRPERVEPRVRSSAFGGTPERVVNQRVHASLREVGIGSQVPGTVEAGIGITPLPPTNREVVHEGIGASAGHVEVLFEV